ncbi:uroporphyrinogen decarboxylase family protein [Thermanaeromonas sp. C210]|uniref:uroporphyrinogen decarboxylase family protein n=1 Tax=Thermanaeromonas sp. C210 TaxID=2731925 RepID=UPI00155D5962|nr:uroporphyrinogen decarboxylase family protein [Thermanaeromonas sp. C210]GFN22847.1 uroporphyrinogen decarboxylase [Thermanaeromonas sp. C210]
MERSPLERFKDALRWQPTGRRCCLPMVFGYAATLAGLKIRDYVTEAEAQVYSQLQAQRCFGYDGVFVYGGNAVEVESLGVPLEFPADDYPYVQPGYQPPSPDILLKKPLPDPAKHGRMPQLLKAARILRREVGDKLPVIAVVVGPVSIVAQILGLEKTLFLLADNPRKLQEVLSYLAPLSRNFALALLDAGAQVIMLMDPVASQSIIPPSIFREVELPLIHSIFRDCKTAGALACWLAITGQSRDLLPSYPQAGADLATVDYEVPLKEAFNLLPHTVVVGNIKPFSFVQLDPGEIKEEARTLLRLAASQRGYILGTGCELPLNSRPENLEALMAAREEKEDYGT